MHLMLCAGPSVLALSHRRPPLRSGRNDALATLRAKTMSCEADRVTHRRDVQALMVLVPEAYRNHPDLQKDYPEARPRPVTPGRGWSCRARVCVVCCLYPRCVQ